LYNRPEVAAVPSGLSSTPLSLVGEDQKRETEESRVRKSTVGGFWSSESLPALRIFSCLLHMFKNILKISPDLIL
jgi:hypothetical protein